MPFSGLHREEDWRRWWHWLWLINISIPFWTEFLHHLSSRMVSSFFWLFNYWCALLFYFILLNGSISFSNKVLFCILISRIRLRCATAVGWFSRASKGTFLRGLFIFIHFFWFVTKWECDSFRVWKWVMLLFVSAITILLHIAPGPLRRVPHLTPIDDDSGSSVFSTRKPPDYEIREKRGEGFKRVLNRRKNDNWRCGASLSPSVRPCSMMISWTDRPTDRWSGV